MRRTSDERLVVVHDATLERTTNGTGQIAERSWEYISSLDAGVWKDPSFANRNDTKVPLLEDVLTRYRGKDVFILIQIKNHQRDIDDVLNLIREKEMVQQCFAFTNPDGASVIKKTNPDILVINDGFHTDTESLLKRAISSKWNVISPGVAHIRSRFVEKAHQYRILVQASVIDHNFANVTERMLEMKVNFLLGDDCRTIVQTANNFGITQVTPNL